MANALAGWGYAPSAAFGAAEALAPNAPEVSFAERMARRNKGPRPAQGWIFELEGIRYELRWRPNRREWIARKIGTGHEVYLSNAVVKAACAVRHLH